MLSACGAGGDDNAEGKLAVVATTTQIGDFARNVGGDRISLTVLLNPNQDAHDFEPSPSQIRRLTEADVVLRNGVGLDYFVVRAVQGDAAKITVVSEGISLTEGATEGHEGDEDDSDAAAETEAQGNDAHIWFSVANARKMVENIRDAFSRADAANASYYSENAARYLAELDALDARIKSQINEVASSCRKLVTNHDAFTYYAAAYGLQIVGSVIPSVSTEARPSASDVANIVRKIRQEDVPAIFSEASVNPALVRQVGREANVKVVDDLYGDSLGPKGSDGATYIGMMESNTRKIVEALKGCS
jgi:zinc/manganese transport system substrate-binding protein/manganese/iron transport system substrate-binding protein